MLAVVVTLVTLAPLGACGEPRDTSSAPPPSRVNAAKTSAPKAATIEAFCDVHATADKAVPLRWPALAGGAAPPPVIGTWRWINVWATWCKPCVEEMPRLARWRDKRKAAGQPIDLAFISVDEADADITAYRKLHPEIPDSLRTADSKAQEAWWAQLGLTGAPPIPIHVFVDPKNRIRCARAGGVRDQDFAVIERLLAD